MDSFSKDVAIVRRNKLVLAVATAPLVFGVALLLAAIMLPSPVLAGAGALVTWSGFFCAFFAFSNGPLAVVETVELYANGTGLYVDGARLFEHSQIVSAYLQPSAGTQPTVRIRGAASDLDVQVESEEHGRALLAAIGHDAGHAVASFDGVYLDKGASVSALLGLFLGVFASLTATALALHALGLGLVTVPAVLMAILGFVYANRKPMTAHVTANGIHLERHGEPRMFVPYGDVLGITEEAGAARLELRTGAPLVVRFLQTYHAGAEIPELAAFIERVREGHAAFEHSASDRETAALLTRGPRRSQDWLRAIRELGHDAGDAYRSPAIPAERLWKLVEDGAATTTARAGAAVVLRAMLDDPGRRRLRVAAEACAKPGLRVALDAAAAGATDDALARALDGCEDDAPPELCRRARRHAG